MADQIETLLIGDNYRRPFAHRARDFLTRNSDMDQVPFPLMLLSDLGDASRPQSSRSCSVTGTVFLVSAELVWAQAVSLQIENVGQHPSSASRLARGRGH